MIDLRSDTVTRPGPAMRKAMAEAEVGDDVFRDDPTVIRLEEKTANLFGMEAALFVPSGTMSNVLAIRAQTHHGDEVICEERSHIVQHEVAAHAALSGVQLRMLPAKRGLLSPDQVAAAIRPPDIHHPVSRLVEIENTHNWGGGAVYPIERAAEIARIAHEGGARVHIDGARLLNASIAAAAAPSAYTVHADSCSLCLSKGLGAPIGSMLAGRRSFVEKARRYRKMLGGAMRQVGIIAAAGIYALDHNVDRLAEDHANAKLLAEALAELPGVEIDPADAETNLVIFDVTRPGLTAGQLAGAMKERGVLFLAIGPQRCRMVTHLDVSRAQTEEAVSQFRDFLTT